MRFAGSEPRQRLPVEEVVGAAEAEEELPEVPAERMQGPQALSEQELRGPGR